VGAIAGLAPAGRYLSAAPVRWPFWFQYTRCPRDSSPSIGPLADFASTREPSAS
jgi:hypothetical protein